MSNSDLSREDFVDSILPSKFQCPNCEDLESVCINRDSKRRKYIAAFQCFNPFCDRSFAQKKWHKCRTCPLDRVLDPRIGQHLKSVSHRQSVQVFERSRCLVYIQEENKFVGETASSPSVLGNIAPTLMDAEFGDVDPDEIGWDVKMPGEPIDLDSALGDDSNNVLNISSPATVPQWKRQCFEQSPDPRDLFEDYFQRKEEPTPTPGYTRQPMNAAYYERNFRFQDGPRLLVGASVHENVSGPTADQVTHSNALFSVMLSALLIN